MSKYSTIRLRPYDGGALFTLFGRNRLVMSIAKILQLYQYYLWVKHHWKDLDLGFCDYQFSIMLFRKSMSPNKEI